MNDYQLTRLGYSAFRKHSIRNPNLRLHHAIYLEELLKGTTWEYSELDPLMQSTLNRFFELVDRVALTTRTLESWEEESTDKIVDAGVAWIKSLFGRPLLKPRGRPWGSDKTRNHWHRLEKAIIPKLTEQRKGQDVLHVENYPEQTQGNPTPAYEIFAGGFEYVPTIGVFPFYLFGERLSAWGIIKYGELDALAMATNEQTLREISTRFSKFSPISWPRVNASKVAAEDFADLVAAAKDATAKIYYLGVGHAAVSLLLRVLPPERYREFRRNVIPLVNKGDDTAISDLLFDNEQLALVLCDLGDPSLLKYLKEERASQQKENPQRLLVMNGLKVPVGFGFSLAALPELLRTQTTLDGIVEAIREWVKSLEKDEGKDKKEIEDHDGIRIMASGEVRTAWLSDSKER